MKATIAGVISFFVPCTAIGLLFTVASLFSRTTRSSNPVDDFLFATYLILFAMTFASAGFLIVTVAAPAWRRLTPMKTMLIAGVLGVIYPVFYLAGLTAAARILPPLFHSILWLATILTHLVPGALAGLAAVLIATISQRRSTKAAQEAHSREGKDPGC